MAKKKSKTPTQRKGVVYLDTAKLHTLLRDRGESWGTAKGISESSWRNVAQDLGVFPKTAKRIADYLKRPLAELLRPSTDNIRDGEFRWPEHPEWTVVDGSRSNWDYTSNGLGYFRCQVRHRYVGDDKHPEFGRARFYDLTGVSESDRSQLRERLTRHAQVCRELAACPQLIRNKSVLPVAEESFWWVIDEWVQGQTLGEFMSEGPIDERRLKSVMLQVLTGLEALHNRKIVLRELTPHRILIASDEIVRLTDFDLAKLLLHGKTVSADWPVDLYRAPEVEGGKVTPQADYYSWGVTFMQAVTGDLTITGHNSEVLTDLALPQELVTVLRQCTAVMPSKRPRSISTIRKAVEAW